MAYTLGIVVLFVGKRLNDAIGFLWEFSIPEPGDLEINDVPI